VWDTLVPLISPGFRSRSSTQSKLTTVVWLPFIPPFQSYVSFRAAQDVTGDLGLIPALPFVEFTGLRVQRLPCGLR